MDKKKLIFLSLIWIISLSIVSVDSIVTAESMTASSEVYATYVPASSEDDVFQVDIMWGDMIFVYSEISPGPWDPEVHGFSQIIPASWVPSGDNSIQITNYSSIDVQVDFAFEGTEGVAGGFSEDSIILDGVKEVDKDGSTANVLFYVLEGEISQYSNIGFITAILYETTIQN